MRTVNDPNASGSAIAAIIGQDPTLAGNLLRIANSAFYRVQSTPVESVDRAVAMVGTDGIRRIIAAALVQPVMSDGSGVLKSTTPVTVGRGAYRLAVADLNGDGRSDVVTSNSESNSVSVLLGR